MVISIVCGSMTAPPSDATHASRGREVERKLSNLVADLARGGSSSDRGVPWTQRHSGLLSQQRSQDTVRIGSIARASRGQLTTFEQAASAGKNAVLI
jgi:hypothetical protein